MIIRGITQVRIKSELVNLKSFDVFEIV